MFENFKSNKNVVYSCKYHVVWCPKYRRKVLIGDIESRLNKILFQVANDIELDIIELEIMPDQVHLLCECDPQFGIHKAVKRLKGTTSRYLRDEFPQLKSRIPTLWTNSYFVSTVGGAPLEIVKQYVANQKQV
ncbi:MAG: IS200/IS605 family transposase [Cyanobacteriota bacterium]|nr:IS200/IS605 family transposase [Cyanobacteriota bacterium]